MQAFFTRVALATLVGFAIPAQAQDWYPKLSLQPPPDDAPATTSAPPAQAPPPAPDAVANPKTPKPQNPIKFLSYRNIIILKCQIKVMMIRTTQPS